MRSAIRLALLVGVALAVAGDAASPSAPPFPVWLACAPGGCKLPPGPWDVVTVPVAPEPGGPTASVRPPENFVQHIVRSAPCRFAAGGTASHFHPRAATAGERFETDQSPVSPYPVLRVATLTLPTGRLAVDDGVAPFPSLVRPVRVGVTHAPVFALAAGGVPASDPPLAFEVRVSTAPVVRWVDEADLGFGTDGGLGRMMSAEGAVSLDDDRGTSDWSEQMLSDWGRTCLSMDSDGLPGTDIIFLATPGDGGYPGIVGYDRSGHIASVVILIDEAPWALMGLTGEPPQFVADELRSHGLPVPR